MQIDVKQILETKAPKTAKKVPGFVIRYLKKIVHQDEINALLARTQDIEGLDFVDEAIKDFNLTVEVEGIENVSPSDRIIIASNHPIGGLDGIALIGTIGKIRKDVITPVNDLLLFVEPLRPIFIPVNKTGANAADNARLLNDTFEGDKAICYFPFGLCSRRVKGRIYDLEWKKTFVTRARRHQRDIIPTHISGRLSNRFYRLAKIRKFLGIKVNIEMLYLVDEFYRQKNKTLKITFGQPISWQVLDKSRTDKEWAEQIRNYSYNMNGEPFDPAKTYTL